jgi:hypothetical protein
MVKVRMAIERVTSHIFILFIYFFTGHCTLFQLINFTYFFLLITGTCLVNI